MMRKCLLSFFVVLMFGLMVSCESTKAPEASPKVVSSPKAKSISSEEAEYLTKLNGISIVKENHPGDAKVSKAFKSDFKVKVIDSEGNPVSGFKLQTLWYSDKETQNVESGITDENGCYSFTAPVTETPMNKTITFKPETEFTSSVVLKAVEEKSLSMPYRVEGNLIQKGVILFVWDYNEKDRALSNSYDVLTVLRNKGCWLACNAPVDDLSYYSKPLGELYKANYDIVGKNYGYLMVGTVKFVKPVEAVEEQYECSLVSDITLIDMLTGNQVYNNTFTNVASGSNWTKCVTKCKSELANKIIEEIIFEL